MGFSTRLLGITPPADTSKPRKWIALPFAGYTPETNYLAGVDLTYLFRPRRADSTTRTSIINGNGVYTLNHQTVFVALFDIFTPRDKYFIHGAVVAANFSYFYYGIGNDLPSSAKELYTFHGEEAKGLVYRNLVSKLYLGIGWRYVRYHNLGLKPGGLLANDRPAGSEGNIASGPWIGLLFDNRDNIYNTAKGNYLDILVNPNAPGVGSTRSFTTAVVDARKFYRLSALRDVLAFEAYGYFSFGDVPFMELGQLGSDMIMRGYYQGRYRDHHYVAAQVEYRRPLFWRIGATLFVGTGEVAPALGKLGVNGLKPNYGAGLRYNVLKKNKLNIRADYGFGSHGISNYYLEIAEAF